MEANDDPRTVQVRGLELDEGLAPDLAACRLRFEILEGAPPAAHEIESDRCRIGSHASNDLVLANETVSRFHCELRIDERGVRVRDLGSLNGTIADGVRVEDAWLREGSVLRVGAIAVRLSTGSETVRLPISQRTRFGPLVGRSIAMRRAFALLERAAPSEATVLVLGETGTGKEGAAEAIHEASPRAAHPFVVVDCAALPPHLLESELFGHERGAFTGAHETRLGAFEAASGGTVFLDEIGELPLDLQPKLLRVLEQRTVRRVGSNQQRPVDVRIVAATHRSLHAAVNEGRFRPDLYYRLAVVTVELPPLRERLDDLPPLIGALLESLGASDAQRDRLTAPASIRRLAALPWPGNVRELRNHLERAIVLEGPEDGELEPAEPLPFAVDARVSWGEARQRALASFEEAYLRSLMSLHGGNVSAAARGAGIDRVHLHRLLRRHRLR